MAATFQSPQGQVPEVDPSKLDSISTLVTTFEERDLVTRNIMNFLYDNKTDYVFIDFWSLVNGKPVVDMLVGYDREKIIATCKNILDYFQKMGKIEGGKNI